MKKNLADCTWHPDNESDYTWFENPYYRDIFLKDAKPEELEKIQMAFASGVWSVFGVWAKAVMSGKIGTPFPDMGNPHSRFWAEFLSKAVTKDRDEFLTFLIRAQLAHNPIIDRPNRGPVPGFTPACKKALLDYLNAFEDPCQIPDPNGLTGTFLIHHSHIPDERMVHLAGQFQIVEAIPALVKLLKARRRLFQLHTDYCTRPELVDDIFTETLRALVRIGLAGPQEKAKVQAVLKEASKKPSGKSLLNRNVAPFQNITGKGEVIWSETLNDSGRGHGSSRHVEETEFLEGGGIPLKHEVAAQALKALEKDGPERRLLLEGRADKFPMFSWLLREDDGQGIVKGDILYYLSSFILEAIELPTGRTIFRFYAGQTNSNKGVGLYSPGLSLTADGHPMVVAQVVPFGTGNGRGWHAIEYDRESGEVRRSFKLAVEPQRAYGPQVWPQKDGSTVFRYEDWLWRQASDGAVVWKNGIDGTASVRCENGTIAVLTKQELTLKKVEDFSETLKMPVSELFKELEGNEKELREDFILFDDRIYLFPRFEGPILVYDLKGNLIWKKKPEQGGYYLNHVRKVGPDLVGDLYGLFGKVSPDGKMVYSKKLDNVEDDYRTNSLGIFSRKYSTVYYEPYGADEPKAILENLPSSLSLVALSEDFLVVHFFDNEHFIACLPKPKW